MLASLLDFGTPTLAKAVGTRCWVDPAIQPVWSSARMVGRALTARTTSKDNLVLHRALASAEVGDVLVVDAGGVAAGFWGEIMSVAAAARGIAGLLIDGGVRDISRIEALGFPVFARHVCVEETLKGDPGVIGDPVAIGGLTVEDRDVVVADADAVVVIPGGNLGDVQERARVIERQEQELLQRVRDGESTIDALGMSGIVFGDRA